MAKAGKNDVKLSIFIGPYTNPAALGRWGIHAQWNLAKKRLGRAHPHGLARGMNS